MNWNFSMIPIVVPNLGQSQTHKRHVLMHWVTIKRMIAYYKQQTGVVD